MFSLRCFRFSVNDSRCTGLLTKKYSENVLEMPKSLFGSFGKRKGLFSYVATDLWHPSLRPRKGFRNQMGVDKQTHRRSLAPIEQIHGKTKGFKDLLKPLFFGVLVSGSSFAGAALWQYETMRRAAHSEAYHRNVGTSMQSFYGKAGAFRQKLNSWWNSLLPGQKVVACLIGLNSFVFVLWRIRSLSPFMVKYFTSNPMSDAVCWPMLLSTFSHYSLWHLFANMYVLWSFAPVVTKIFGKEQFVATYISAAMVSGFASYAYKIARRSMVPSLGASGAIMALIGATCIAFPQARLSIAFVDQVVPHSFSADSAMKCLIVIDTLGILLQWRFFDHAAHLGGMLFGIWYIKYGHKIIWKKREPLVRQWHTYRGGKS